MVATNLEEVPLLQVVICTYNRAHLLVNTLESLALQDSIQDQRWSVLVVDNNCVDNTMDVVGEYRQRIQRLEVVVEPRQGLTEARQRGLLASSAPWIAFVDDDCILEPDWVRCAIEFCDRNPQVAAFNGKNLLTYEIEVPRPWLNPSMFAGSNPDADTEAEQPGPLHGAGLVVRRDAVIRSGWLDNPVAADRRGSSLVSGGDNELSVRAGAGGGELWYVPSCRLRHSVQADRLGFGYLWRLNFRLAEAGPLMQLLQCSKPIGIWHTRMLRWVVIGFLQVVGLRSDALLSPGAGWRGRLLALSRAFGTVVGYAKLMLQPKENRRGWCGLATEARVDKMHRKIS